MVASPAPLVLVTVVCWRVVPGTTDSSAPEVVSAALPGDELASLVTVDSAGVVTGWDVAPPPTVLAIVIVEYCVTVDGGLTDVTVEPGITEPASVVTADIVCWTVEAGATEVIVTTDVCVTTEPCG